MIADQRPAPAITTERMAGMKNSDTEAAPEIRSTFFEVNRNGLNLASGSTIPSREISATIPPVKRMLVKVCWDCQFSMWKNDRFFTGKKKELTATVAAALLSKGRAAMKGLYSEKTGKTYDADVLLADMGEKYVNYKIELKKTKKPKPKK